MFLGRRGQTDWKWIVGVVVAVVIISIALLVWQAVTTGPAFPTTPEAYADAWKDYGDFAFNPEGQPWRLASIFFFPLLAYFSMFFFSVNLVFGAQGQIRNWEYVQRPLIVFSFAISFIILPFPVTYQLYQVLGGISVFVLIIPWVFVIAGFILILYHAREHAGPGVTRHKREREGEPERVTEEEIPASVRTRMDRATRQLNFQTERIDRLRRRR